MSEWVTTLSLVVLETAVLVWRPLETDFFAVLHGLGLVSVSTFSARSYAVSTLGLGTLVLTTRLQRCR